MADSAPTGFRYHSYRRVCDVCGQLRAIEEMHRQDDLWVCTYDAGERVRTQLDRLNARERPFQIKPVPHPKPQDPFYPNILQTDDGAVFSLIDRQIQAKARFELITSGSAPQVTTTTAGGTILAMGWSGRYLYDLIQANDRPKIMLDRAKALLRQLADFLLSVQEGSPTGTHTSFTRDQNAFFGAIRFQNTNTQTEDNAAGGLALLYAYRILGDVKYIVGARAAANYLRNVQAIGKCATPNFPSQNAGGTVRLYTGSVVRRVIANDNNNPQTIPSQTWFFFPGTGLLTLEFWNELKITDGDQSIGATSAGSAFASAPAQLLSQCITDIRTCWAVGITDSTGTLINGFSSTTPREIFNAFPTGTGNWEFNDGDASTGTQVTSQNFAEAVSSLYNYEGATSQVTTISDWLRSFTSNPAFETPANTSTRTLYRSTTGTYDPTVTIATVLTVRDAAHNYAPIKINGSSNYDWGAFGLLARLWASRNTASFRTSRLLPLGIFQRFFDGTFSDGLNMDRIVWTGISGLSMQTNVSPMQNDAVLSAQFGRTFRESRN